MATIVMNIDECDIAHEARKLEEYRAEVTCAGREPQLTQAGESPVVQSNKPAKNPGPAADPDVALLSAPVEVDDSVGLLRSASFPKCP